MTISILRTAEGWWVRDAARAARIDTAAATTQELLSDREAIDAATGGADTLPVEGLRLLSPVTAPCRVVAQMTNFASHAKDTGVDPKTVPLAFFRKASGSISGPFDDVVKPGHIRFLDYEVEIGLVIGRDMAVGATITDANLSDYVAGLVVTNDVSAREVQLTKTQFYEAKSYPTFTPVGPALVLLDADELKRFVELRLRLQVNGEVRQDATVDGDMIYRPAAGAAGAGAVPATRGRRPGVDRHARGHSAERATQTCRKTWRAAGAGNKMAGVLQTPSQQPEISARRRPHLSQRCHRRQVDRPGRAAHRCQICVVGVPPIGVGPTERPFCVRYRPAPRPVRHAAQPTSPTPAAGF